MPGKLPPATKKRRVASRRLWIAGVVIAVCLGLLAHTTKTSSLAAPAPTLLRPLTVEGTKALPSATPLDDPPTSETPLPAMPTASPTPSPTVLDSPTAVPPATSLPSPTASPTPDRFALTLTPLPSVTSLAMTATPTLIKGEPITPTMIATLGLGTATASPTPAPSQTGTPTPWETPSLTTTPTLTGTATLVPSATATLPPIKIEGAYIADEVVLQFKTGTNARTRSQVFDLLNVRTREEIPSLDTWLLKVPEGSVPSALAAAQDHPAVNFAEPNYVAHAFALPNDPGWERQGYLANIQLPQAWELTTGSPEIIIAIIDTGIDAGHPDLAAKIWANPGEIGEDSHGGDKRTNGIDDDENGYIDDWLGWNAIENNGEIQDGNGHGTHVAGIAAASSNNGLGIAGVVWDSPVMVIKALDDSGRGGYAQVAKALVYAAQHGARVINLSLGGGNYSRLLNLAIDFAYLNGISVVAAAGDHSARQAYYPAAFQNAISVGASDGGNQVAGFSAYGEAVDLYAPGVSVYSTVPGGGYLVLSGTSMAAAHVAGAAALLAGPPRLASASQIKAILLGSAAPISEGAGLLQVYAALQYGAGTPTPSPTPTEPPGRRLPVYPMAPTAVLPPSGPTATPLAVDPHVVYTPLEDDCAACHHSQTALGFELRQDWPEEFGCLVCHTAGGTGTNVEAAFSSYPNSTTAIFSHDVFAASGVHAAGESSGGSFGGSNRHVECEDCHEPHEAARGLTYPPANVFEMNQVSGVDPLWTVAGAPEGYAWLLEAEREYQVCFKCHSGFTSLPAYRPDGWDGAAMRPDGLYKLDRTTTRQRPDHRDLGQAFNPNNASFHPVAAPGRNLEIPAASFANGWSVDSLTYCADCHTNASAATQGSGPHGSPNLHILGGGVNYTTVDTGIRPQSGELCFQCHDYTTYADGGPAANTLFRNEAENLHDLHVQEEGTPCYVCHNTHGSEQLHLLNFDTSIVTITGVNRDSQNAWENNAGTRRCFLSCHNQGHGAGMSYTP